MGVDRAITAATITGTTTDIIQDFTTDTWGDLAVMADTEGGMDIIGVAIIATTTIAGRMVEMHSTDFPAVGPAVLAQPGHWPTWVGADTLAAGGTLQEEATQAVEVMAVAIDDRRTAKRLLINAVFIGL